MPLVPMLGVGPVQEGGERASQSTRGGSGGGDGEEEGVLVVVFGHLCAVLVCVCVCGECFRTREREGGEGGSVA